MPMANSSGSAIHAWNSLIGSFWQFWISPGVSNQTIDELLVMNYSVSEFNISVVNWYVGNRTNFIERSLLYPQHVGRSWSRIFGILYIQCEISSSTNSTCWPIWNLTQRHIFWKFSQKPKYIKLMDDNLQGCRNKKRHDKNRDKEQMSWRWSRHRLLCAR